MLSKIMNQELGLDVAISTAKVSASADRYSRARSIVRRETESPIRLRHPNTR